MKSFESESIVYLSTFASVVSLKIIERKRFIGSLVVFSFYFFLLSESGLPEQPKGIALEAKIWKGLKHIVMQFESTRFTATPTSIPLTYFFSILRDLTYCAGCGAPRHIVFCVLAPPTAAIQSFVIGKMYSSRET